MRKWIVLGWVILLFASPAVADVIIFKSGSAKRGIIEKETPTMIRIRVKDRVFSVSLENIEEIRRATPEENRALRLEWQAEKAERAEKRRRERKAEEQFKKEQEEEGLVEVDGEWLEPADAERLRQKGKAQRVQREQAARKAEEAAATPAEEPELPDFVMEMSEEKRQQYLAGISQIGLSRIRTESSGRNRTKLTCLVKNRGEFDARNIIITIECFDRNDQLIFTDMAKTGRVRAGKAERVQVSMRVQNRLIDRVEVRVTNVW